MMHHTTCCHSSAVAVAVQLVGSVNSYVTALVLVMHGVAVHIPDRERLVLASHLEALG